jgi:hypothetical protein
MSLRRFTRLIAVLAALAAAIPSGVLASSHREAPLISQDPTADNTDVYAFVSPTDENFVTLVANYLPMEEPAGGPNFYRFSDQVYYDIHIDNDGDARADITYRFQFDTVILNPNTFLYATGPINSLNDSNWNVRQFYDVTLIMNGQPPGTPVATELVVPPVNVGPQTTPDYDNLADGAVATLGDGTRLFAGQRDDPFYVNTGLGVDGLAGYNCQSIVIEVPIALLTRDGSDPDDPGDPAAVLGVYATASRRPRPQQPQASVATQLSRLGMPLVNEVVIPLGEKDRFNASLPMNDAQFGSYVLDPELAALLQAIHGVSAPPSPRCDLAAVFLTGIGGLNQPPDVVPSEMMRLNVAIKPDGNPDSRFGLLGGDPDGFPNGRRLADDVVDIELRVVAGVVYQTFCDPDFIAHPLAAQLGDGVDRNDVPFLSAFPYLGTPHQGFDHLCQRVEPPHPPERTEQAPEVRRLLEEVATPATPASEEDAGDLIDLQPSISRGDLDVAYSLSKESEVEIRVFDVSGREVQTLVDRVLPAGGHTVRWDGRDSRGNRVTQGLYFFEIEAQGRRAVRKATVVR